jgi:hypothetical protein
VWVTSCSLPWVSIWWTSNYSYIFCAPNRIFYVSSWITMQDVTVLMGQWDKQICVRLKNHYDDRADRKWDLSWWSFPLCVTSWVSAVSKYNEGFSFVYIYISPVSWWKLYILSTKKNCFLFRFWTLSDVGSVGDKLANKYHWNTSEWEEWESREEECLVMLLLYNVSWNLFPLCE